MLCYLLIVDDGVVSKERPRYRGLTHAFTNIVKEDGLRGLYRVSDI